MRDTGEARPEREQGLPNGGAAERERIRGVYARRRELGLERRYAPWEPANVFMRQERERVMLALLRKHHLVDLADRRILDVGCGTGTVLRDFLRYGCSPAGLFGVDLDAESVERARRLAPQLDWRIADAGSLPFEGGTFDLVLAFTILSSIRDGEARQAAARELLRVSKPQGRLLVYDFSVNPVNRETRPIGPQEIERLFQRKRLAAKRVTLAPPIARAVAPHSMLACELLLRIPKLRTHWLVLL